MQTIIGQAARDDFYFPRPKITNQIWEELEKGNHLSLIAPRRVGKSSILLNLHDSPKSGYSIIYYTSESVNNINEFYKKLFNHILEQSKFAKRAGTKLMNFSKDLLSRIDEISIADGSLKLGESKISYLSELSTFLDHLDLQNERIVILVDEFAQTIENIIEDSDEKNAIQFLQTMREIRQNPDLLKRIQFIYAGSIGLENVVSRFNGSKFINDLTPVLIQPLNLDETKKLVDKIIDKDPIEFNEDVYGYLLEEINWWIPFYFNLILDEADKLLKTKTDKIITKEIIDKAISNALKLSIHFKPWFERLRIAFKGKEFMFIKEFLNTLSKQKSLNTGIIIDMSVKYELEESYTDLMNTLKHDGYINNTEKPETYKFNSPLLRKWWYNNVAN